MWINNVVNPAVDHVTGSQSRRRFRFVIDYRRHRLDVKTSLAPLPTGRSVAHADRPVVSDSVTWQQNSCYYTTASSKRAHQIQVGSRLALFYISRKNGDLVYDEWRRDKISVLLPPRHLFICLLLAEIFLIFQIRFQVPPWAAIILTVE